MSEAVKEAVNLLASEVHDRALEMMLQAIREAQRTDRGLRGMDAAKKLGISKSAFYDRVRRGILPPANDLTGTWSEKQLDEVMAGQWRPAKTKRGRR